jgi:hypothetical protein
MEAIMIDFIFTEPTPTTIVFNGSIEEAKIEDPFPTAVFSSGEELKQITHCSDIAKQLIYDLMELIDDHDYFDNAVFDLYLSPNILRMHAPFGNPKEQIEYHLDTGKAYKKTLPDAIVGVATYVDLKTGLQSDVEEIFYSDREAFNDQYGLAFDSGLMFGAILRDEPLYLKYLTHPTA